MTLCSSKPSASMVTLPPRLSPLMNPGNPVKIFALGSPSCGVLKVTVMVTSSPPPVVSMMTSTTSPDGSVMATDTIPSAFVLTVTSAPAGSELRSNVSVEPSASVMTTV